MCTDWVKANAAQFHVTKHILRNYVAGTMLRYRPGLFVQLTVNCETLEVNVFRVEEAWLCLPCYTAGGNTWYYLTWACTDTEKRVTRREKIQLHPHGATRTTDNGQGGQPSGAGQVNDQSSGQGSGGTAQGSGPPGTTPQEPLERKAFVIVIQKRDTLFQQLLPGSSRYVGNSGQPIRQGEMADGTLYGGEDLNAFYDWRYKHFCDTGEWIEVVPKESTQYIPKGWSDTEYALSQDGIYYDKYLATVSTPGNGEVDINSDAGWDAFVKNEKERLNRIKDREATPEETNLLDLTEEEIFD